MTTVARKYKARIVGQIPYHTNNGFLTSVPLGQCEILEEHMTGPFKISWHEGGEQKSITLPLGQWALHIRSGAIKVVDEPDIA